MDKMDKQSSMREYKGNLKKIFISLAVAFPILILISYGLTFLSVPSYVSILINISVGGFICLLVYAIFGKIERRKQQEKLTQKQEKDPFAD